MLQNDKSIPMNVCVRSTPLLLLSLCLTTIFGVQVSRAQSVSTNPVGYLQETITPSSNGTTRVYSALSFPLQPVPVFVGLVASTSNNTITLSGSIPSGLTTGTAPYMVHVESAANSIATGQSFLITAAGTNYVTVSSPTYTVQSILAASDQVAIRPAETLGGLFGTTNTTVLLQGGASSGGADVVYLWNGTGYTAYYYYTSYGWVQDGDASYTIQNNMAIYPDEGVLVGRLSTNTLPATYAISMGGVPTNAQTALVNAPGLTFVSNPLPVPVTLSQFGFTNAPSWLEGSSAGGSDLVYLWTGSAWQDYYYYSGYGWVEDGDATFTLQTNTPIPAGAAILVRRRNTVAAANAYIGIPLTYTP